MGIKTGRACVGHAALATVSTLALLSGAAAQEAAPEPNRLPEIVVTAQQRTQSVLDVPIAVQVVTSEQIQAIGADDMADLAPFIPGLTVSGSPTQPHFTIRGISTSDFGVGTDPAVGIYVDGVYSARSGSSLLAFDDVSQIEVLKGPQGTLFGRNAAAGAISITSNKPSDEYEGDVSVRLGSYGERRGEAVLNIPLTDDFAIRIDGVDNHSEGWLKDAASGKDLNSQDNFATRVAARWRLDDKTTAILTWSHDNLDQPARPLVSVVPLVDSAPISNIFPGQRPPFPVNPAGFLNPFDVPVKNDAIDNHEWRRLDDLTLSLTHDYGWVQISSLSNFRYFHTENLEDEDGTNLPWLYFDTNNREKNEQYYQEFKLSHADDLLDWVGGVSYYREHAEQTSDAHTNTSALDTAAYNTAGVAPFATIDQLLSAGLGAPYTGFENQAWEEPMVNRGGRYDAYAAFGDVIWHAMDKLDVTLGARFTHDDKAYTWDAPLRDAPGIDAAIASFGDVAGLTQTLTQILEGAGYGPALAAGTAKQLVGAATTNFIFSFPGLTPGDTVGLSHSWSNFSPRIVLSYKITPQVNTFVSFTEGYKAGGFNSVEPPTPAATGLPEFANEKVRSYEGGIKSTFPDESLRLDASIYHYEYLNKQSIVLVPTGSTAEYLINTEDDQATGVDVDALWAPIDGLELSAEAGYIDATVMRPGPLIAGVIQPVSGGPTGEPLFSAVFSAAYTIPLGDDNDLRFNAEHSYRGHTRCNNDTPSISNISSCNYHLPFDTNAAQSRTDMRVSFLGDKDRFEISAFVNNVFDNRYITGLGGLTAPTFGAVTAEITAPRLAGVDMTIKF
jgi:iron complex outermembrane receptor protein